MTALVVASGLRDAEAQAQNRIPVTPGDLVHVHEHSGSLGPVRKLNSGRGVPCRTSTGEPCGPTS
jgi:hypothetical protein